jgi:osmoprotectant transport system substrate-binding protein
MRSPMRYALGGMLALFVAVAVAACGSSNSKTTTTGSSNAGSSSAGSSTNGTTTASSSAAAGSTSTTSSASLPGKGKPAIVLGDENFEEEYVLGSLYEEALAAKGYTVSLKGNIGSAELTYKAFQSGQIGAYPEYTGTLLTAVANITAPPSSAQDAYTQAKAWLGKHGATMIGPTPFFDSDAIGTTKAYAAKHHLTTIADLKSLGKSVTLGGLPEFATRAQALVGLKKEYGIDPTFVPRASGLFYNALDSGKVDTSDVFTTDPELDSGKYVVLTDPKHVFGYQNVGLVVKSSVVSASGPAFTQTITAVNNLLTQKAIIALNAAVVNDKQSPTAVAKTFLKANGLL